MVVDSDSKLPHQHQNEDREIMPRVCTSQSEPLDFCQFCFPQTEESAREKYAGEGEGPEVTA